mmetsp:Transcript_13510/g.31988  ORF Transcript_13510/g.31988 Transcript_13510/m.31988 type:complete len:237 (+) Transcript_13510:1232-1942(+)
MEGPSDPIEAHAVERRVDDLEAVGHGDVHADGLEHLRVVRLGDLMQRVAQQAAGPRPGGEVPQPEVLLDGGRDALVVGGDDLAAVAPVHLVAVVILRVVRGGDHDPRRAAEVRHRKGDERGRDEAPEKARLDPLRHKHRRRDLRKALRPAAPVVADHDPAAVEGVRRHTLEVPAEPLCRLLDRDGVHAVEPRTHEAPQPCRAKLQPASEDFVQFTLIFCLSKVLHHVSRLFVRVEL